MTEKCGGGLGGGRPGRLTVTIRVLFFCCLGAGFHLRPGGDFAGFVVSHANAEPLKQALEFDVKPYLRGITRDSVHIMWRQTAPGEAVAAFRRRGGEEPGIRRAVSGSSLRQEVFLTGLDSSTFYEYEVVLEGGVAFSGAFRTEGGPGEPFSFIVWGGTGSGESGSHSHLVDAMLLERPDLLIHTGDLVVRAGMRHYRDFFESVSPLASRVPIYPCLGIRDLAGDADKGLELFRSFFPGTGKERRVFYSFVYGNSKFIFLDTSSRVPFSRADRAQDMVKWTGEELEKAEKEDFIKHVFVVLHHGPYGSVPGGSNEQLKKTGLLKLFMERGVDVVFSGKERLYERGNAEGLRYIVTAGGGALLEQVRQRSTHSQWAESTFHYVRVLVSGDRVEFTPRRMDGTVIDSFQYEKKSDWVSARESGGLARGDVAKDRGVVGTETVEEFHGDLRGLDSPEERNVGGKTVGRGKMLWMAIVASISAVFFVLGCLIFYCRFRKK